MSAIAIKYFINPFGNFWSKFFAGFMDHCEHIARARAAHYLVMNGYHKEAKRLMTMDN